MDLTAVMSQLESLGTSQAVKTYKRHGAGDDVFGVSYADLKKLKKSIGPNHDLALELWQTGNVDARSLATMVADPDEFTPAHATQWMKDVTYPPHGAEVAAVIAESNFGNGILKLSLLTKWRTSMLLSLSNICLSSSH